MPKERMEIMLCLLYYYLFFRHYCSAAVWGGIGDGGRGDWSVAEDRKSFGHIGIGGSDGDAHRREHDNYFDSSRSSSFLS